MAEDDKRFIVFSDGEVLSEDDDISPGGRNGMSSYAIFEERKYYDEVIYPSTNFVPEPFDIWHKRPHFGKVNFDGDACFASKDGLKQIETNVWVLDFVADAFNEFKQQFLFLNKKQVEGTPYELLKPSRGWSSAIDLYDQYVDSLYDLFLVYIESENREKDILNFNQFMDVMYDFINDSSPDLPLTFSRFITSNKCPSTISGLMIDISTDKHDNDTDKFNNFIKNDNFECFANTAERFGFKVDKNFPGRLIADIKSPVMNREGNYSQPSWQGGAGYMQKYPQRPNPFTEQVPPPPVLKQVKPPKEQPEIPFDIGDRVSIATVRVGTTTPFQYYMLKNYTETKNRFKEPGYRPKKVNNKNMYLYLRNEVLNKPDSTFLPIYGEIVAINPSSNDAQLFFGNGYIVPNFDVAIIKLSAEDGTLGRSPANIWSTEQLFAAESSDNAESVTYLPGGGEEYDHNYSNLNNTTDSSTYIQVPLDAIHLKDDNVSFVYSRFNDRVNYSIKRQKYEQQVRENQELYNQQLASWEQARNDYEQRLLIYNDKENFYLTAPRMSTLNLFDRRFGTAYFYDFELLREICLQFYFSYVTLKPEIRVVEYINCPSGKVTKEKIIKREELTRARFNEKYPETYWIKQYILMLDAQSQNRKSIQELRMIKTRAIQNYNFSGIEKTLKYLRDEMIKK